MRARGRWISFTLSFTALAACRSEPGDDGAPAVLSLVRSEALEARLRAFDSSSRSATAGRVHRVSLHLARGFSAAPTDATGSATVDLEGASVELELGGLGAVAAVDVWLLDNLEGRGATTLPDPGDRLLHAGRVPVHTGSARATLDLERGSLAGFELDRVVIALPGDRPQGRLLLLGGPSAFERVRRSSADRPAELAQELATLVRRGAELFEHETFAGNGRTCTTCHPAANNLTLDPSFIAGLTADDPLFVAERVPALAGLEHPALLRERGLILEAAVAFYNDRAFNESAGGRLLATLDSGGIGIRLDTSEVTAVAHLLRVLNVLENLRSSSDMLLRALASPRPTARRLLAQGTQELGDARGVLESAHLHPRAAAELRRAEELARSARHSSGHLTARIEQALAALSRARADLVE